MKKILSALLSMSLAVQLYACWFTERNFNGNYIAGVNNYSAHYTETSTLSAARYYNGMGVSLPITVFVKVGPRTPESSAETALPITQAVLQYKILPDGEWVTVRTLSDVTWAMYWDTPVALFGRNNINPQNIEEDTEILIRVYFTDGVFETGDLDTDITSTVPDVASKASGGSYEGGWDAPFVFRVKFNGNRRPVK